MNPVAIRFRDARAWGCPHCGRRLVPMKEKHQDGYTTTYTCPECRAPVVVLSDNVTNITMKIGGVTPDVGSRIRRPRGSSSRCAIAESAKSHSGAH